MNSFVFIFQCYSPRGIAGKIYRECSLTLHLEIKNEFFFYWNVSSDLYKTKTKLIRLFLFFNAIALGELVEKKWSLSTDVLAQQISKNEFFFFFVCVNINGNYCPNLGGITVKLAVKFIKKQWSFWLSDVLAQQVSKKNCFFFLCVYSNLRPPQGLPLFLLQQPQVGFFEWGQEWEKYEFFCFCFLEKKMFLFGKCFFWKIFAKMFWDSETPSGILWGPWKWQFLVGGEFAVDIGKLLPKFGGFQSN